MKIPNVKSCVSAGYACIPDPVPAYWHQLATVEAPEYIIAEFSPDVFLSFPRAHLVRFDFDAREDCVQLNFSLTTLTINAGSARQCKSLVDAILAGKCSVLVALKGKAPANLFSDEALPHLRQPDGNPNPQVVFVPQMWIYPDISSTKHSEPRAQ